MRAFFVTAAMFAGKDALWITDRTGHTSLAMVRTYERDVRRWRELGEAPANVAEAIPEVAATSGEVATTATAPDAEPPASDGQRNSLFATGQVAAQVAPQVRSTVPPVVVTTRKCTGRDLNPYASRRRNLNPLRLPVSPPVR